MRDIGDDERHRGRPQPPSARRVAAGRHRFLCRELGAVALATNSTISMKRGTKRPGVPACGSCNAGGAARRMISSVQ